MIDPPAEPDAALARRLRDDPEAARRLEELRRTAYGRDGSAAPLVEVPAGLRARTGYDAAELPGPLVALLAEEARLVDEGAALLAAERPDVAATDPAATAETTADDRTADGPVAVPARRRALRPGPLAAIAAGVLVLLGLGVASAAGVLDADRTTASPPSSEDVGSAVTSTATPRGQAMGTPDGRRGSVVPDFTADPPVRVPPTDAELAEGLRVRADQAWGVVLEQQPAAVRPDVATERVIDDEEDHAEQQVACLRDAGISAYMEGQAGYGFIGGDPVAVYACAVRFPLRDDGARTDAELAYIHDYYVSFLIPCYAAEGRPYEGDVPAVDDFIAGVHAERPWTPFPDAMDNGLAAACPVLPAAYR